MIASARPLPPHQSPPLVDSMVSNEAASDYRTTLSELTSNNKTQINLLTILADDYAEQCAPAVVEAIDEHIHQVPVGQKLPGIYLMDSILKNVTAHYKDLISRVIIKVFLHVFSAGDEKMRMSLYKLRLTWNEMFPRSKLYDLDVRVKQIDTAWPVMILDKNQQKPPPKSQPSGVQVHVNPRFIQSTAPMDASVPSSSVAPPANIIKNDPRMRNRTVTAVGEKKLTVEVKPILKKEVKREAPVDEPMPPPTPAVVVKKEVTPPVPSVTPPIQPPPKDIDERRRDDHPKRKHQDPPFPDVPPKTRRHSPPRRRKEEPPRGGRMPPIAPTTNLGSHAFVAPAVAARHSPTDRTHSPAQAGPSDYSPPPIYPPPSAEPPRSFAPSHVPPAYSPAYPPLSTPSSGPPIPHGPGPLGPPPPIMGAGLPRKHVITDEAVKLDGIPANNRIFVDGKAHEVLYIQDVAVIEKDGLPHRIFFTGAPRNVVIDGSVYSLAFGETKEVFIDGDKHTIRFGAPSRELYLGGHHLKGAFGGPPIFVTINGVRHEIRLGGPAPEVKIMPDPSYDLTRFLNDARFGRQQPAPPPPKQEPVKDIQSLLAKLGKSGILDMISQKNEKSKPAPPAKKRDTTPPIPAEHRGGIVDRLPEPHPLFSQNPFDMRYLKTRYTSVVAALHEKRDVCPQCGLRINLKSEEYEKHLDWHVKKNIRSIGQKTKCRAWYGSAKDWIKGTDASEEEEQTSTSKGTKVVKDDESAVPSIPSTGHDNKCSVCGEKLENYFDDDADVWMLRDCVKVGDKVCHKACAADVSTMEDTNVIMVDEETLSKPVLSDPRLSKNTRLSPSE